MAKKNKRQQPKKPQRGGRPSVRPPVVAAPVPPVDATVPTQPAPVPRPVAAARPVPRTRGRVAPGPLPSQDASIPLERVPYFRSDLRRIAITAGLMFVLLIVGSIILRNLLLA